MKKSLFLVVVAVLLCPLMIGMVAGAAGAEPGKNLELNFTTDYMDKHPTVQNAFFPWMKLVEQRSQGRIKMTYFNPNTLAPAKDAYDSTVNGVINVAGGFCGFNPGKFPLSELIELPMLVPSAEAGSLVTWELYRRYPEWRKEYEKTKMLWQWSSATYQFHTTRKLVRTLDDLKGMKIIGWSPKLLEIIKGLGANGLMINATDTYLALQRGMADGVLCPLAPVRSYKISDAAKYHTIIDVNVGPFWAAMNLELWKSLPQDLQKVLEETTGIEMARLSGKTLDEGAIEDSKWMKGQGHTFYLPNPEERARWFQNLKHMHTDWVKKMEKQGIKNAGEILHTAVKLGEDYAKTTGRGYSE